MEKEKLAQCHVKLHGQLAKCVESQDSNVHLAKFHIVEMLTVILLYSKNSLSAVVKYKTLSGNLKEGTNFS
jgi:hypothetical protein